MTSASSRRSFYPLPPSIYPQPLVDPCSAFETTYGHNHCSHSIRDEEFFRTRTLHERSATARALQSAGAAGFGGLGAPNVPGGPVNLAHAAQGIYPRHGIGQFVTPYYRRDSKGFRRPFTQPPHVDDTYTARRELAGGSSATLARSGFQLAHPQSRPTYAAAKSSAGAGATFATSYRNSGVFDSINAAQTSRPARIVADGLQMARSQRMDGGAGSQRSYSAGTSRDSFSRSQPSHFYAQHGEMEPEAGSLGYDTNDVRDSPPEGAELVESGYYVSNLEQTRVAGAGSSVSAATHGALLSDPLLDDPLANARRKPRTVYKRAFGQSQ